MRSGVAERESAASQCSLRRVSKTLAHGPAVGGGIDQHLGDLLAIPA